MAERNLPIMPAEMLPASANVAGGLVSQPHLHSGRPWQMQQDYARDDIGTSQALMRLDPETYLKLRELSGESPRQCSGGIIYR